MRPSAAEATARAGRGKTGTVPGSSAPAAEHGEATADDEPGHGGADDRLLLVAAQVAAPVGRQLDLAAEAVDGRDEALAVVLDRLPDLLRGALGRRACAHDDDSSSLVLRASSMAICGVGGEPFLNSRAANIPARPPSAKRIAATTKKPQKYWVLPTGSAHQPSQDRPWKNNVTPQITNTAAAPPAIARASRRLSFWLASALASSISSRKISEARSLTSLTASAIALALLWSSSVAISRRRRCA